MSSTAPLPQQQRIIIIKLGGSLITDKAIHRTLREDEIQRVLAQQLLCCSSFSTSTSASSSDAGNHVVDNPSSFALRSPTPSATMFRVYIVHGAGSFAHMETKQNKLTLKLNPAGLAASKEQLAARDEGAIGLERLHAAVYGPLLKRHKLREEGDAEIHVTQNNVDNSSESGGGRSTVRVLHYKANQGLTAPSLSRAELPPAPSAAEGENLEKNARFQFLRARTLATSYAHCENLVTALKAEQKEKAGEGSVVGRGGEPTALDVSVLNGDYVMHPLFEASAENGDAHSGGDGGVIVDVVSGDTLAHQIAEVELKQWQHEKEQEPGEHHDLDVRLLFLTRVGGVFDRDPNADPSVVAVEEEGATTTATPQLIERLTVDANGRKIHAQTMKQQHHQRDQEEKQDIGGGGGVGVATTHRKQQNSCPRTKEVDATGAMDAKVVACARALAAFSSRSSSTSPSADDVVASPSSTTIHCSIAGPDALPQILHLPKEKLLLFRNGEEGEKEEHGGVMGTIVQLVGESVNQQ